MNILEILNKIGPDSQTLPDKDIRCLYSICVKIACRYLARVHYDKFGAEDRWNDNLDDVASDSVVPLFVRNANDTLHVVHSYKNWKLDIKTDNDARFFISRIVWNRVEQRVAKILKERDPVFNKIHKTLINCLDGTNYHKLSFFGRVYIVKQDVDEICCPVINYEEFNLLPSSIFYKKRSILLKELFDYIIAETEFFPAIPINILVNRIKNLHAVELLSDEGSLPAYELSIDLNSVVDSVLKQSIENLKNKYFITGKVNDHEFGVMKRVFENIASDIKLGGMKGSFLSYAKCVDEQMESSVFYSKYHPILNYLLNKFKADIEKFFHFE